MEQMITRASSLGIIRHDVQHKRIQLAVENAAKADHDVFKSVRILHQGEFNPKREAEVLKVIQDKKMAEHSHHDRIDSRIRVELKQAEQMDPKSDEFKKRMAFKRLDL
jgi:deoxyhypusine synthase